MRDGLLQQIGTPEQLYTRPQNVFVAGFIGSPAMNLVPSDVVDAGGGRIAGFRPEHVQLGPVRGDGLSFPATVEVVEYLGDEQLVHMTRKDTPLQAKLPVEEHVDRGEELTFSVPRDKLHLFDSETEERIS
jgi:ABC-type sugar transport system ATPase subunit